MTGLILRPKSSSFVQMAEQCSQTFLKRPCRDMSLKCQLARSGAEVLSLVPTSFHTPHIPSSHSLLVPLSPPAPWSLADLEHTLVMSLSYYSYSSGQINLLQTCFLARLFPYIVLVIFYPAGNSLVAQLRPLSSWWICSSHVHNPPRISQHPPGPLQEESFPFSEHRLCAQSLAEHRGSWH